MIGKLIELYRFKPIKLGVYIIFAVLVYLIIKIILNILRSNRLSRKVFSPKKIEIIFSIITGIAKYSISIVTIMLILRDIFNVNPALIVTATGVLGIVIGLGIQGLLRDFVSGFFILFENKFEIGDFIIANNIKGQIVDFRIKNIRIKDNEGRLHIIPNGAVGTIIRLKGNKEYYNFKVYIKSNYTLFKKEFNLLRTNFISNFGSVISGFSEPVKGKKAGKYEYASFKLTLKPFYDNIAENLKELIIRNSDGALVHVTKESK